MPYTDEVSKEDSIQRGVNPAANKFFGGVTAIASPNCCQTFSCELITFYAQNKFACCTFE